MGCDFNSLSNPKTGTESRLSQLLFDRLNNNKAEVVSIYGTATDAKFKEWFKDRPKYFEYDIENVDGRKVTTLIKEAKEYQRNFEFRVGSDRNITTNRYNVFPNIDMENHAINILADLYLRGEDVLTAKKMDLNRNNIKRYLLATLKKELTLNESLTKNQKQFIIKMMHAVNNENSLFEAVLRHPKTIQLSKSLHAFDINEDLEDNGQTNEENGKEEGYEKSWSDSIGERRSIEKTISREILREFQLTKKIDSIEKVNGVKVYDYSNNTYSGFPETIDFFEYYRSIRNNANFDNIDDFIQSLHDIARTQPNRMALEQIADRADSNKNLANMLYVNFNQPSIKRNSFDISSETNNVNVDNIKSDPVLTFRNTMLANINNSFEVELGDVIDWFRAITSVIHNEGFDAPVIISDTISFSNPIDAINYIVDYLDLGVTSQGINNYLQNGEGDYEKKAVDVLNLVKELVQHMNTANIINKTNNKAYNDNFREWALTKQYAIEAGERIPERIVPTYPIIQDPISTAFNHTVLKLSTIFSKYQEVKTEFNSKNIEGELVADTIKQSYLTRFFSRMRNSVSIETYFKTKAKFVQYEKSNILYEQRTANGSVIPGLLRIGTNGELELTPYYRFLDMELFNGAKNTNLNTNATYSAMSQSDFDITAMGEYQNNGYNKEQLAEGVPGGKFAIAKYFIQTPSDAPKTFVISSYKLAYKGLESGDTINRNHPIYKALYNILEQEKTNMRKAFERIFYVDENDQIEYEKNDVKKYGRKTPPKIKQNGLYKQYHYNGSVIKDGKLTGNVFEFWTLLLDYNDKSNINNNLNNAVDRSVEGMREFLYGGNTTAIFEDYIDNYIKVKTTEAVDYFNTHKDSITDYSEDLAKEFALNYTIQYNNFTEFFSGNPKFYRDSKDTIKRNKEVQGSGLIYSGYSIDNYSLETDSILASLFMSNGSTVNVSRKFNYLTVPNTIKSSSEKTIKDIQSRMKKGGAPQSIIDFITGKYQVTSKVNDAQSYITLDEFVRRVWMSGQYESYKDTIDALYDESKSIDYNTLGRLIQVQKNFYYELQQDAENELEVPVQIKNAEFVLIPRFLGDSELSIMERIMKDKGIDQLNTAETEKASMTKLVEIWNNEGNLIPLNETKLAEISSSIKTGYYSSLYKQQDTPQHMDAKNKAGVQIVKKMLDNLSGDKGAEYRNRFFELFTTNIEDSFNTLTDELGVEKDVNGNLIINEETGKFNINNEKFYKLIRDEFSRLGLDSNMMEYTILDENGNPNMPNYMPIVRKKIMNVFQSIFTNNVTNQKLPGFHAAQVANTGLTKSYTEADYKVKTGEVFRKLQYHPNGADYMEVLLPKWAAGLKTLYNEDGSIKQEFNIEDVSKAGLDIMIGYRIPTEGKQSIAKLKVVGFLDESQGSTIVVPDEWVAQTGSDFDVDSVYGIYYEFGVSNGKLFKYKYLNGEDEVSTKKRYNYYINSLNLKAELSSKELLSVALIENDEEALFKTNELLASKEGKISFEEFNKLPIAKQNSRKARNNAILDLFSDIMSDPTTAEENFMSSNFDDIKEAKTKVYKIIGKDKEWIDTNSFIGQSDYRNQVMSGATLKSISVKRDGFTSISNVAKTTVNSKNAIKVTYTLDKSPVEELDRLKIIYGENNVEELEDNKVIVIHDKLGWSLNNDRNVEGKLLTVYSSETTALILDGVKEGGIMNVDTFTFDVFKTFIDLGIDYETAILFITQPGITEIVKQNNTTNSIYTSSRYNPIGAATKNLLFDYVKSINPESKVNEYTKLKDLFIAASIEESEYKDKGIDKEQLKETLISSNDARVNLVNQLSIIDNFRRYKILADSIGSHANVMNTDKTGAGQSIFDVNKLIHNISNLKNLKTPILYDNKGRSLIDSIYPNLNYDTIVPSDSSYPSLYAQLKYSALGSINITSQMFITESDTFKRLKLAIPIGDEATNYAFENYIIAIAMNNSRIVTDNMYKNEHYNINVSIQDDLANRRRISGYRQDKFLSFEQLFGSKDFNLNSLNKEQLSKFMLLSPANKVFLMKQVIKGESIFDYLEAELVDNRKLQKGKQSGHRIIVKDNTSSPELMYELFRDLYYKDNPLFKTTAEDLIRYAIAVEGMQYNFSFVSKIIPAEILYNERNNNGTDFINDTNKGLLISDNLNAYDVANNFFKQYSNSNVIPKYENKYNKSNNGGSIVFDRFGNDIAVIDMNKAEEVGLTYKSNDEGQLSIKPYIKTNKYVKGKKPILQLYKAIKKNDYVYLFPVNQMERNEVGSTSVNSDNNVYAQLDTYISLIDRVNPGEYVLPNAITALERARMNIGRNYVQVSITGNQGVELMKRYLELTTNYTITDNNLNPESNDAVVRISIKSFNDDIKNTILSAAHNGSKLLMTDSDMTNRIIKFLEENSYTNYEVIGINKDSVVSQYINQLNNADAKSEKDKMINEYKGNLIELNKNTGAYQQLKTRLLGSNSTLSLLNRVDTKGMNFIAMTSAATSALMLSDNSQAIIKLNQREYLLTNFGAVSRKSVRFINDYGKLDNKQLLDDIVTKATTDSKYGFTNLVKIELLDDFVNNEVNNVIMESTDIELDNRINNLINEHIAGNNLDLKLGNNSLAEDLKKKFRNLELDRANKNNLTDITRATALSTIALSVEQKSNNLLNRINKFNDGKDNYYSIDNPKLYDILLDNPQLQIEFCKLLLDVDTFISDNDSTEKIDKYSQNDIDNAIDERERRALIDSNEAIAKIKQQYNEIISIKNKSNFARTMFFDKVISKLSTNPLIQAELQSIVKPFKGESWFQLWFTDAQESNVAIMQVVLKEVMNNLRTAELNATDKVIEFQNKLNEIKKLNPNINIASIIDNKGRIIRSYTDEFEDDMIKLRETAQEYKFKYGQTSVEYDKARRDYERFLTNNIDREYIYNYYNDIENVNSILDGYPIVKQQIKEIHLAQSKILSNLINNDYSTLNDAENKELKALRKKLNALRDIDADPFNDLKTQEAIAVDRYLTGLDAIKKKYNETSEKAGFAEKYKTALDTINVLERTMSKVELDNSTDYKKAKEWINYNTFKKIDDTYATEIANAFKTLKSVDSNSINFKKLAQDKYDSEGIINGNLFNESEINFLNNKGTIGAKSEESAGGLEKLIRNKVGDTNRNIYQRAFYKNIANQTKNVARDRIIKDINKILINYFDNSTGKVNTSDFSIDDMKELSNLYNDLESLTKEVTDAKEKGRRLFIKREAEFKIDFNEYEYQKLRAERKGVSYLNEWLKLNYGLNTYDEEFSPNIQLYGYMKPKDKWIDKDKTAARKKIDEEVIFTNTKYYEQRIREELNKGTDSFDKWYQANHIFNPNTQTYEPIRIWQNLEYKDQSKVIRSPKPKWLETKIKDEFKNPKYEKGKISLFSANNNYNNSNYISIMQDDSVTKKLYDLVTTTLDELVIDKRSKSYINKGYIPSDPIKQTKEGWRDYQDSILRSIGIYDTPMKSEIEESFGKRNVNMPMLHRQQQVPLLKIRAKSDNESDFEYADYLDDIHTKNKLIRENNNKSHVAGINTNYEDTFSNFIREAIKFNAIQESSFLMRLTLEELKAMTYYKRNSRGEIMYDKTKEYITGIPIAAREQNNNAAEHFKTQMQKLIYNEFELNQGNWSKLSRVARSITSAKFMMLNLTGGISNILTGGTQILMENIAGEYLGHDDYRKGSIEYGKNIMSYFSNSNELISDNLVDAIIKRIDVLNLDSQTDIAGGKETELARKAMNYLYFQQSAGEHAMQNTTMLGMMYSHRVIKDETGRTRLITLDHYKQEIRQDALRRILEKYDNTTGTTLNANFDNYVNSLKQEGNEEELQKYVYFTKDIVTEYLKQLPNDVRIDFINEVKAQTEIANTEFAALPTFFSQMELVNGIAQLNSDSGLTNKDIAVFRNKVISVNHKVHGIYDKIGAAKAQGTWWGGIMFQFHKHLVPGWAKRYGYVFGKGIYNESRESVDKGSYVSLYEFLSTPFKSKFKANEITEEIEAISAWQNFGNNAFEFIGNARIYYNILPEYDKANIRRSLAEICGMMGSILMFIGARMMWDEREKDTQLADYIMYWGDRLASENQQYTPLGAMFEAKKLYANPFAANSTITDAMTAFGVITEYMFTGDEKSLNFQNGVNYGKNKIKHILSKQVPIYTQYMKHERLGKNNTYYKTGQNMIGFLPIRDWVDEWKK